LGKEHLGQGRIAVERGLFVGERLSRIDVPVGALVVDISVEQIADGAGPGLEHDDPTADLEHARRLFHETMGILEVVKDVDHHQIADGRVVVRQGARIDHGVVPRSRGDVRGDDFRATGFEETRAGAELHDRTIPAAQLDDASEVRLIDPTQ